MAWKSVRYKCRGCRYHPCATTTTTPEGKLITPYRDRRYIAWRDIRNGCYNVNSGRYKGMGGIGAEMYPAWRESCANFILWAELKGWTDPESRFTVGRHNRQGDYTPSNCFILKVVIGRSADLARRFHLWDDMEAHTFLEWCTYLGKPRYLVKNRIGYGWTLKQAFLVDTNEDRSKVDIVSRAALARRSLQERGIK